jgi:hypothetical protein
MENLAPGDTTSSVIAPPYSTATSTNLWPVYCNRWAGALVCLPACSHWPRALRASSQWSTALAACLTHV